MSRSSIRENTLKELKIVFKDSMIEFFPILHPQHSSQTNVIFTIIISGGMMMSCLKTALKWKMTRKRLSSSMTRSDQNSTESSCLNILNEEYTAILSLL